MGTKKYAQMPGKSTFSLILGKNVQVPLTGTQPPFYFHKFIFFREFIFGNFRLFSAIFGNRLCRVFSVIHFQLFRLVSSFVSGRITENLSVLQGSSGRF